MRYKKGQTGNPKGRPPGKRKRPIKSTLQKLLENSFPVIEQEMTEGSPEVKREFFMDLTKIVLTANI